MPLAVDVDHLQLSWMLPYELVDLSPHSDLARWGVVLDDGNVLHSTEAWCYAVVARIHGQDHCLAALPSAHAAAAAFLADASEERAAWLLRIAADGEVLVMRGADDLVARPLVEDGVALLMDYGKVLCDFDYAWFHDAYQHFFGRPIPEIGAQQVRQLRPAFEAGGYSAEDFFQEVRQDLDIIGQDWMHFHAAWGGILRPNADMIALARHAARQAGWALTLVSNIDPILVEHSRKRFGLSDLFEGGVFSYMEGVRPKYEDASMWRLARQTCAMQLGSAPRLVVASDDTAVNLHHAEQEEVVTHTIQFRNPWQWQFELGRIGAYLPRQRG